MATKKKIIKKKKTAVTAAEDISTPIKKGKIHGDPTVKVEW